MNNPDITKYIADLGIFAMNKISKNKMIKIQEIPIKLILAQDFSFKSPIPIQI